MAARRNILSNIQSGVRVSRGFLQQHQTFTRKEADGQVNLLAILFHLLATQSHHRVMLFRHRVLLFHRQAMPCLTKDINHRLSTHQDNSTFLHSSKEVKGEAIRDIRGRDFKRYELVALGRAFFFQ
jgi:hypothetical protein